MKGNNLKTLEEKADAIKAHIEAIQGIVSSDHRLSFLSFFSHPIKGGKENIYETIVGCAPNICSILDTVMYGDNVSDSLGMVRTLVTQSHEAEDDADDDDKEQDGPPLPESVLSVLRSMNKN